jgi:hypothetical protein
VEPVEDAQWQCHPLNDHPGQESVEIQLQSYKALVMGRRRHKIKIHIQTMQTFFTYKALKTELPYTQQLGTYVLLLAEDANFWEMLWFYILGYETT